MTVTFSDVPAANMIAPPAGTLVHVAGGNTAPARLTFDGYGAPVVLMGRSSSGSPTSPSAWPAGANLLQVGVRGHDGTQFASKMCALINLQTAEVWNTSANGSRISIWTTAIGRPSTAAREVVAIEDSGDMTLAVAGAGLVVESPDGTKKARIGIDNDSNIVATPV